MKHAALALSLAAASLGLVGCDALGIETAPQVAAKRDAEAHAIGSACRHAVRSIEDCFRSNPKAVKAAMFDGWKEMDIYMRENEIVGMPSTEDVRPAEADEAHDSQSSGDQNAHADNGHKS
ncbi:MAG TPA: hypothetical protein VIN35_07080 [Hydrogenophaga sp.]